MTPEGAGRARAPGAQTTRTKRMSYGFQAFDRMRQRCLLSLGYMHVIKCRMKISDVTAEDLRGQEAQIPERSETPLTHDALLRKKEMMPLA